MFISCLAKSRNVVNTIIYHCTWITTHCQCTTRNSVSVTKTDTVYVLINATLFLPLYSDDIEDTQRCRFEGKTYQVPRLRVTLRLMSIFKTDLIAIYIGVFMKLKLSIIVHKI